jgi:protocadherin Fat 1/2/3
LISLLLFLKPVLCQDQPNQLMAVLPTATDELADDSAFQFTQSVYNATIEENSLGRMFVECDEKMGIYTEDPDVNIKYRIVSGDEENFFKATAEPVGNFVFLVIRTRTSNVNVLNRERVENYELVVRATFRDSDRQRLRDIRASTVVRVRVLDTNDLDPFFNPSYYSATVPEDQPLHASILRHAASQLIGLSDDFTTLLDLRFLLFACR